MEEESWRILGGILEASRGIWKHLAGIWGASGKHLGSIWEASGRLEASGGPLNQEVHSLSLKCRQTAATDHSTAEWRRSDARSTVKHTVLESTPIAHPPATHPPIPKTSRQNPYRTSLFGEQIQSEFNLANAMQRSFQSTAN